MITDMVLRVSGLVTYEDGNVDEFNAVFEDGNVVNPFSETSREAFKQLWQEKSATIEALLESLGGSFSLSPGSPTTSRVVNSWTFLLDGRISRSDKTHGNFNAVFEAKGGSRVSGESVFDEVLADSTYRGYLEDAFDVLCGSAGSTITA